MCVVRDDIKDHMRNESFLVGIHSTIEFTSKSMCVAGDNIKDNLRNE
jgi:hypothetical protein